MKTGLSLSFCVLDLAKGDISIDEVEKIIAGICAPTRDHFLKVLEDYKRTYWAEWRGVDPDEAARIALWLYDQGKIEQPRLSGQHAPKIDGDHWQ